MQTKPVFSNAKIFALVVFFSAAIITSLFVYHMSHQAPRIAISADDGLVFPVARDMGSLDLVKTDNSPFTEAAFRNHWTLVFFGFTHCADVCPNTLEMMKRSYGNLSKSIPNLQVVFVTLDPTRDTHNVLASYTRSFNPSFIGVSGTIENIRKFQSQLGVYSERAESSSGNNYQLQHTSSIMLINPQGKWAGLYKFGMSPDQFERVIEESVKA